MTGAVPWSVELPWLLLGGRLGLDGPGHAFLLLSLLLWVAAALAAPGWWRGDARTQRWAVATLAGHLLVHVALDAATFQLGYALMGLASFGLLAARRTPAADAAARRYLVFVIVGEVLLFAGLVLGYGRAGSADVARLTPALATAPQAGAAVSLVVIAFAIKSAVLPLHGWLLSGYVAAPLPVRVVLAGAMINAGLLGWLRFVPLGSEAVAFLVAPLALLGLVGAWYGALRGALQRDARAALACSSISQMGLVTVGFAAAMAAGPAAVPMLVAYGTHHGLAKGTAFLALGMAGAAVGASARHWRAAVLALPLLALIGVPGTSGALAKARLADAVAVLPPSLATAFALTSWAVLLGTATISARALHAAWRGTLPADDPRLAERMALPMLLLLVALVATAPLWLPRLSG